MPLRVARDLRDVVEVARDAVHADDPVFHVARRLRRLQFGHRLVELFTVAGVHPQPQQRRQRHGVVDRRDAEDAVQLRRVVIRLRVVEVDHVIAEVRQFLREPKLGLAAPQPLIRLLAQRDVADEADEARRLGLRDLAPRANLAADADDARLTGLVEALEVPVVLRVVRRRHQHVDVVPDDLLGAITEDPLRGEAELLDSPAMVDHDDRVDGGVEQRTEIQFRLAGTARAGAVSGRGGVCVSVVEQESPARWHGRSESYVKPPRRTRHPVQGDPWVLLETRLCIVGNPGRTDTDDNEDGAGKHRPRGSLDRGEHPKEAPSE